MSSSVAVAPELTVRLLVTVRPDAPDCNVPLPAKLTSPAPSALLFPTCNVPPSIMVPIVPCAGPYVFAFPRTSVPVPRSVNVSELDVLAITPEIVSKSPLLTTTLELSFRLTAV